MNNQEKLYADQQAEAISNMAKEAEYLASEEYILEAEFQAELKAEQAAAIEEKRKAFMEKRKKK